MRRHLFACYLIFMPVIIGLDGFSKAWWRQDFGGVHTLVSGWLRIQVLRNYGFFQGMFSESLGQLGPHLTLITSCLVTVGLITWAWMTPSGKTLRHWGFACMIGGALGNVLDRAVHGYVLDFLQIGPLGVYNFADFALMVGAGLLLVGFWRKESGGP